MKPRLLLTSALFVFVQITAPRAQVTVDVSKITCEQLLMEKPVPAKYVVLWLSGSTTASATARSSNPKR
jgi:hypothetical protein